MKPRWPRKSRRGYSRKIGQTCRPGVIGQKANGRHCQTPGRACQKRECPFPHLFSRDRGESRIKAADDRQAYGRRNRWIAAFLQRDREGEKGFSAFSKKKMVEFASFQKRFSNKSKIKRYSCNISVYRWKDCAVEMVLSLISTVADNYPGCLKMMI
ncbi:MAG: hypothetical protein FWG01_03835 [Betaproteobacteria bacterium]|nr:hypothetical protein [Betaproteobacteria bacterium]